jgi:hypothetical protein
MFERGFTMILLKGDLEQEEGCPWKNYATGYSNMIKQAAFDRLLGEGLEPRAGEFNGRTPQKNFVENQESAKDQDTRKGIA